ncbi:MAG: Type phosphodiesterase / nucleotide pyrophosphatase [Blastocatellia bacterium]|nr:Type phosphodiesterase / nucleotide pyrophosphatase [Blastocatellia bacterium]
MWFFAERSSSQRLQSQPHESLKRILVHLSVLFLALLWSVTACAQARATRVVIIKIDGLPYEMVERFAREYDPMTGRSLLPWFDNVFFKNGTRLTNFYVRGMSLSAPSWSTLDTGQHLQIKGNVEFDRDILRTYDYLNFIPFYFKQATGSNVDMPGTEVLDSLGVPMLIDAYDNYQRNTGSQLYGRGARIDTLRRAGQTKFLRNPKELAGEFLSGLDLRDVVPDELERELIESLQDQRVHYLDFYTTTFDHVAHHNNDRASHLAALRDIDGLIGRIWTGIQKSQLGSETVLVVVSDHGFNTDERVISQGFNLVKLLGSYAGGGHHVITKRRLLMDYSLKSINLFVPPITTTSSQSHYLQKQSAEYPTALLDFDGNERAGLHLRNSDLNLLHILLQQLQRKDLSPQLRRAAGDAFFGAVARDKANWHDELDQLDEELGALRRAIKKQRALCESQPKKFTVHDKELGRDDNARRVCVLAVQWTEQQKAYSAYVATMRNLLSLRPESFDPFKLRIAEVIPEDSMGQRNSIHDLQNYVVGPASAGLVLQSDGSLDLERSFLRVNYLTLIQEQNVRNNVQQGITNRPVDFIATRIPRAALAPTLSQDLQPDDDVVWLYGGPNRQALVLPRGEAQGQLRLRYLPIAHLTQDDEGVIHFDLVPWQQGLPLRLLDDPRLDVPLDARVAWLNEWHTDVEWLHAVHKTQYSNGLIGLHEQFTLFPAPGTDVNAAGLSDDDRLLHRLRRRQRRLVETDMLILANNHWNFDVRGFNPGGNHGSFFRISTHATLMLAGGEGTGVPRGLAVSEPYDSLSVTPTILALTGNLQTDNSPVDSLARRGFTKFPGRVIQEVVTGPGSGQPGQRQ